MRLLDPFAGYSLANGIPVYHAALFIGSFSVAAYSKINSAADIEPPL